MQSVKANKDKSVTITFSSAVVAYRALDAALSAYYEEYIDVYCSKTERKKTINELEKIRNSVDYLLRKLVME